MDTTKLISCRNKLLDDLKKCNSIQAQPFEKIIQTNQRLIEQNNALKNENIELKKSKFKIEQDHQELLKIHGDGNLVAKRDLDEERLKNKDEIIRLQQQLYEQSQSVIQATNKLKEKVDELSLKEEQLHQCEIQIENLKQEIQSYQTKISEDKKLLEAWQEEKIGTSKNYAHIVEKYEIIKKDYDDVLMTVLNAKKNETETLNRLNELEFENRELKLKAKGGSNMASSQSRDDFVNIITENVTFPKDMNQNQDQNQNQNDKLEPSSFEMKFRGGLNKAMSFVNNLAAGNNGEVGRKSSITSNEDLRVIKQCLNLSSRKPFKFDNPEGEIYAIKYHKHGKYFATGGVDKKVKIWEYNEGNLNLASTLIGSNASIASIDIDETRDFIAAGSCDKTWRLWSLNASRMRMTNGNLQPTQTLTGHENKITALKFLSDMKVVTGSLDRLVKIWDLTQQSCVKTIPVISSCTDLSTMGNQTIVSGHFNKRVYFWDSKIVGNSPQNEIVLEGKVTSIDVSSDKNYILASSRDDNSLNSIDVRMFRILKTYVSSEYRIAYDYSRAFFSPDYDSNYVCGCSGDGSVIIWNRESGKVEKTLKEESSPLITMCWDPQGIRLIATNLNKKAFIWNFY